MLKSAIGFLVSRRSVHVDTESPFGVAQRASLAQGIDDSRPSGANGCGKLISRYVRGESSLTLVVLIITHGLHMRGIVRQQYIQ